MKEILSNYPGQIPVYLSFITPEDKRVRVMTGEDVRVQPNDDLIDKLEQLLGEGVVNFSSR